MDQEKPLKKVGTPLTGILNFQFKWCQLGEGWVFFLPNLLHNSRWIKNNFF